MPLPGQGSFATNLNANRAGRNVAHRTSDPNFQVYTDIPQSSGRVNGQAAHVAIRIPSKHSLQDDSNAVNRRTKRRYTARRADSETPGARKGSKQPARGAPLPPSPPIQRRASTTNPEPVAPARRSERLRSLAPRPSQLTPPEDIEPENEPHNHEQEPDNGFVDISDFLDESDEDVNEPVPSSFRPQGRPGPRRRRAPRGILRDGKKLPGSHMIARQLDPDVKLYVLPPLRQDSNICPHCGAYQYEEEWRRPGSKEYWGCCSDGRVPVDLMNPEGDPEGVEALPESTAEERAHKVRIKDREEAITKVLHDKLYAVEEVPVTTEEQPSEARMRLTAACRQFQEQIVTYNNVLSFTSEAAKTDHEHSSWTTFRAMGGVKHLIGPAMPEEGDEPRFCQIYNLDSSQEALERRLQVSRSERELLAQDVRSLQRLIWQHNPYATTFRMCHERLGDADPIGARIHLKENDASRSKKGTHNRPTSDEVACVMIIPEGADPKEPIDRDVLVQPMVRGDGPALIKVPYWHSSYMPLRYPLLFPLGEQSWTKNVPSVG